MMPAPSIVSRYGALHQEALRSEVHHDRLAATCEPDASLLQRTTRRVRSAASSLLTSLYGETLPGRHGTGRSDPATHGAL
jgi:hypothetical protein